ncbi:FimV/HubP family polar landmark protein [Marinobacter xestospongiae]|uniref:FimV/HubP family polar landmark protein n=1 Tax=Marinobacter xestospongiae TaxID=994319 RepID=A0ABU3W0C8_9GAMM|nr:FimV/HubP family polar landmark protein [Marinobacter xestospongiae]MDV2079805.1 FimV/HubP family polar landmark protein [Marinobacter xestospongiae]
MKVRKLAVALALAGGLGSGVAQALGLGDIELQSYLNEPLEADISLNSSEGVNPNEVFVNLASEDAYRRVGIDRNYFLSRLRFNVSTAADGSLIVNVSTTEPVKEPYLNFLLEVTWPSGRLMREYAVLVDPPVYAEDSGVEETVQAPTTRAPAPTPQRQVSAPSAPSRQAPAPRASAGDTLGPTSASDTLWGIASQVRPNNSVSHQQVMLAIQDLNPDAFIGGNINRLKRGQVLRVPSLEQIESRTAGEASRQVAQQNQQLSTERRAVDARDDAPSAPSTGSGAASSGPDELKLLVADEEGPRDADDGGSAGGQGQLAGGVDAGSAVAMEELEATRRENEDLSGRVEDLQDQVETLQRLLELKNTQLAEFEQAVSEGDTPQSPSPVDGGDDVATGEAAGDDAMTGEGDASQDGMAADTGLEPAADMEGEVPSDMAGDESDLAGDDGMMPDAGDETSDADTMTAGPDADADMVADGEADMAGMDQSSGQPESAAGEQAAPATTAANEPKKAAPPAPQPEPEKGFPDNLIDEIMTNPMYQIGLGGGVVALLLGLLLVARRNASKEKEFYEQLTSESDDEGDSISLGDEVETGEEAAPQDAEERVDPIAEADTYVAYGRTDQAVSTLENAISREPSRTDLRLKLLSVYADAEDRDSFEKQYSELEAFEDEQAIAEAESLRARLEEAESVPSIDDLESQLMSDSFGATQPEEDEQPEAAQPQADDDALTADLEGALEGLDENDAEEDDRDTRDRPIEYDLSDIDVKSGEDDAGAESADADETAEPASEDDGYSLEFDSVESADSADDFDAELAELEQSLDLGDDAETGLEDSDSDSLEDEFASLDLEDGDLDSLLGEDQAAESKGSGKDELESLDDLDIDSLDLEEPTRKESAETPSLTDEDLLADDEFSALDSGSESSEDAGAQDDLVVGEDGALDESFLDELDAELDKVAGEDESDALADDDGGLDDLELDISDEDLALMEEVAEEQPAQSEPAAEAPEAPDAQTDSDELAAGDADLPVADDLADEDLDVPLADESVDEAADAGHVAEESDQAESKAEGRSTVPDIDESELGDDDDFDFLAGTDEAATKLDLARAYIEMGDSDGARDILEEVAIEGNDQQKAEAQDLLKTLS